MKISWIVITALLIVSVYPNIPVNELADRIVSGIYKKTYDVRPSDTNIRIQGLKFNFEAAQPFATFHAPIPNTGNFAFYYAKVEGTGQIDLSSTVQLSDRGFRGSSFKIPESDAILIAYEVKTNNGNTIAIRYYQNQLQLGINNFAYEYQLSKNIRPGSAKVLGTPIIQEIYLEKKAGIQILNKYQIRLSFHHEITDKQLPGIGFLVLDPSQHFKASNIEYNYEWEGIEDDTAIDAMRAAGCAGKIINQRDFFKINSEIYYFYDCFIHQAFSWRDERIFLFSPTQKKAVDLGINLDGVISLGHPRITLLSKGSFYS